MSPKVIGIILVIILALSGLYLAERYWLKPSTDASATGPGLMQELPDATVFDRDGNSVSLAQYRGKTLVINFWATWCLPCVLEMPFVNRVYNEFRDQDVVFVGISEDAGGWPDIDAFLTRLQEEEDTVIDYPILLDVDQKAGEAFGGVYGLPNTFFVDSSGRITKKHIGIIDIDDLRNGIRPMLPQQSEVTDDEEENGNREAE